MMLLTFPADIPAPADHQAHTGKALNSRFPRMLPRHMSGSHRHMGSLALHETATASPPRNRSRALHWDASQIVCAPGGFLRRESAGANHLRRVRPRARHLHSASLHWHLTVASEGREFVPTVVHHV